MRIFVLLFSLVLGFHLSAQNAGVYLYSPDESLSSDLLVDINEFFNTTLEEGSNYKFLPREKIINMLEKVSSIKPEVCLKDDACLKENLLKIDIKLMVVARIIKSADSYSITITKYSLTGGEDKTYIKEGLKDIPAILGYLKSIKLKLLKAENGFLVLKNDKTADGGAIFLDGKLIGILPYKEIIPVSEGLHNILVRKKGFLDFKRKFSCKASKKCIINIKLKKERKKSVLVKKVKHKTEQPKVMLASKSKSNFLKYLSIGSLVTGVAISGIGIYFYFKGRNDVDYLNSNCFTPVKGYYNSENKEYCYYSKTIKDKKVDAASSNLSMATVFTSIGGGLIVMSGISFALNKLLISSNPKPNKGVSFSIRPQISSNYSGVFSEIKF